MNKSSQKIPSMHRSHCSSLGSKYQGFYIVGQPHEVGRASTGDARQSWGQGTYHGFFSFPQESSQSTGYPSVTTG